MNATVEIRSLKATTRARIIAGKVFVYLVMACMVVVCLFPIVWIILSSFKTNAEVFKGAFFPGQVNLDAYKYALNMAPIMRFFVNSVFISVTAMLINVTAVSMGAYAFSRGVFKGKETLFTIIMAAMVLPSTAVIQPVYMQLRTLGMLDTKAGLILVYCCFGMPVGLMLLRTFFSSIPLETEESAAIDGASFVMTFVRISVPMAKPGIATVMVLRFLEYWNEFTYALVLTTSVNNRTMPLSLAYFVSSFSFNYPAMFAAITLSVLPALVIFALFSRQVVNSMVAGAVKG
ncbi:MAG: carbohydrate ABC transporter permease [Clostridiales bacterium]|jgi:raffinose/stachyose/melibiose transport system permease protein|nr:carbohydrate ABC transporter permease [Clostridiales bacterium]